MHGVLLQLRVQDKQAVPVGCSFLYILPLLGASAACLQVSPQQTEGEAQRSTVVQGEMWQAQRPCMHTHGDQKKALEPLETFRQL